MHALEEKHLVIKQYTNQHKAYNSSEQHFFSEAALPLADHIGLTGQLAHQDGLRLLKQYKSIHRGYARSQ
uniref:Uncharacterized protein n=1 Tax=Setaria italica TaxID=4555 RepID=K3ZYS6_SETIT